MATSRLVRPASLSRPAALLSCALTAAALAMPAPVHAAEPAACLSPDPAQWPSPSKPYFMTIVDNSGSMNIAVAGANSCGYEANRLGHARCAVQNALSAYSGEVNFGLATYTWRLTGCPAGACGNCTGQPICFPGCTAQYAPGDGNSFCGPLIAEPSLGVNVRAGGYVVVPMLQDHYWATPPDPSNVPTLLGYVDNTCTGSVEIGADSNTPIGGSLFAMYRYFSGTYADPFTNVIVPSPLGTLAQGERPCRSLNVILLTDGDETCNTGAFGGYPSLAAYEANRLFNAGVNFGGQNFKIKTHVIGFAGATISALNAIAAAGGTVAAYSTANEAQLSTALSNIIAGAIKPEVCDNTDNNCNGCTDEGYAHYCDVGLTCCAWGTQAQRTTCLNNYKASITPMNPQGNLTLLPCTTATQQTEPQNWLCFNPGDICDSIDNNCNAQVDENILKCGNPPHCPLPEVCNGADDDCDGLIDEGSVCPNMCIPSAEICDGCDNDCNGIPDNGIASIPCGLPSPANCVGMLVCAPKAPVPPGTCAPGGGFSMCNNNPLPETCDGIDNNCNGIIDDGIPSIPCGPPGLNYGPNSHCKQGMTTCVNGMTICNGVIGPESEVCDGIDNDCDFTVDDSVPGVGQPCGINQLPCTPGVTACVAGALVCTGGSQPQPEVCDNIDNNCNGTIDDAPLADAPGPGMNGCWTLPGNCCQFPMVNPDIFWCPPVGGTCTDVGTLTPPCNKGTLLCSGGTWSCTASKLPGSETCDGVDNDCNGMVDDGNLPGVGGPCGSNVGECVPGTTICVNGVLDCSGTGPVPEICDGKDNDCDGTIDNNIPVGGPCTAPYDMVAYPGPRDKPPCQPGNLVCNGMGGLVCVGGVGPAPEVCDGIDNDCDGMTDETGAAPDGITGSPNPNPPPMANIGDPCPPGVPVGVCLQGTYQCLNGMFACLGGQGPTPESCDCEDNDCNGMNDNPNPNNIPPLCSPGKDCVKTSGGQCQCAPPCNPQSEFPCPSGQSCEMVTDSQTGMPLGNHCIADPCMGVNCAAQTVKDAMGNYICAPKGTMGPNCTTPPVCTCKGQNGCQDPCFNKTCPVGQGCANVGPNAGKCVPIANNCYDFPCASCDIACNNGVCTPNPCSPNPCPAGQACKPSPDWMTPVCSPSCANVSCPSNQTCVDGACVDICNPACPMGQTCDLSKMPPSCVMDKCVINPCTAGKCCEPVTGLCGNCPCTGVVCPTGEECQDGQCINSPTTGAGGGGGGTSVSSSSTGSASSSGGGGAGAGGIWGLPTGGGGCSCEVGASSTSLRDAQLLLLAAAAALGARRKKRAKQGGDDEEVAS